MRQDDRRDPWVCVQHRHRLGNGGLSGGVRGDLPVMVNDDDVERCCTETREVVLDDAPGLNRLARRVLPSCACQRRLDSGCECAEDHKDHKPPEQDEPKVSRRPAAQASERATWRLQRAITFVARCCI